MAETLSLNQFAPNVPLAGMYVYLANLPQQLLILLARHDESELLNSSDSDILFH